MCHSRHSKGPVLLHFQGVFFTASCTNTVLGSFEKWRLAGHSTFRIQREKKKTRRLKEGLGFCFILVPVWGVGGGGLHNFQAARRNGLPQLWIWTHGGQQCAWGQMKKNKKYKRNPLASPSKELTNVFIYIYMHIYIYLVLQTTSLSLFPLLHSCIPSSSPRSRLFFCFQVKLPRTFSLSSPSVSLLIPSLFSVPSDDWRWGLRVRFAQQMKEAKQSQRSDIAV